MKVLMHVYQFQVSNQNLLPCAAMLEAALSSINIVLLALEKKAFLANVSMPFPFDIKQTNLLQCEISMEARPTIDLSSIQSLGKVVKHLLSHLSYASGTHTPYLQECISESL